MSGIKTTIEADFDSASAAQQMKQLLQQFNAMGREIARQSKVKFQPVDNLSIEYVKKMAQQFEALKRISGDFNKRLNATGQGGAGFFNVDYTRTHQDAVARNRAMQNHFQYVTGMNFGAAAPSGGGRRGGGGWSAIPGRVAGAAARASGPIGGIAAEAGGAGMSSGFGAGLAGLVGGIVALGVSKAVSSVVEKIGQAESNAVAYDKLKRTLGDVNVSFDVLKNTIEKNASNLSVTFDEAAKLTGQFAKLGNVTGDQYRSLMSETGVGIGMSKAFGLDPSDGVGALGAMRGLGITRNEQDTRRMALLIGETIGKSNTFAKAGEVMDAIVGFATNQTRQSMGAANVAGYTGMFSAMVGSGIPGMDPAGASSLLGRVNSTLAAGGARGEASQFFSSMVGSSLGLDPIQTQIMREGGAFATTQNSFGKGSIADSYGINGPDQLNGKTWIEASTDMLRKKYGHNPGLLAKATSEHFGIGMNQAMAILSIKPNAMGEMAGYAGDLTKLNAKGMAGLTKVVTGSAADRQAVAADLLGRTGTDALTKKQADDLRDTMAAGTVEQQKQMLSELIASRDQEETQGKDIYDSKVALDNIKVTLADKLIPITQSIRDGIMYIAGGGKMSMSQILGSQAQVESDVRTKRIEADALSEKRSADADYEKGRENILLDPSNNMSDMKGWAEFQQRRKDGTATPQEIEEWKARAEKRREVMGESSISPGSDAKLKALSIERKRRIEAAEEERRIALEEEGRRRQRSLDDIDKADRVRQSESSSSPTGGSSLSSFSDPAQRGNLGAYLDSIGQAENAGYNTIVGGGSFSDYSKHPNIVGLRTADGPSTAAGKYQITKETWDRISRKLGLTDFSPASQDKAAIELLRESGALDHILSGDFDKATPRLGGIWQALPSGRSANQGKQSQRSFDNMLRRNLRARDGDAIPEGMAGVGQQRFIFDAAPIEIIHRNERGERVRPSQTVAVSVRPASPFGTERLV